MKKTTEELWASLLDRFWSQVEKTESCWNWTGYTNGNGYGRIYSGKHHSFYVHRLSHELNIGPIPDGLVIDHLCRNTMCVNPGHLEAVTTQENSLRGLTGRLVTACPKGHAYDASNTSVNERGHRRCKACNRANVTRWKANRAGARQ